MATSRSDPTSEEMAAIVAAVELVWPKPVVVVQQPQTRASNWRFSGRWWGPLTEVSGRRRPW